MKLYNLPFTEKFANQWETWLIYRKEIKKPYKSDKTINGTLKKLTYYTEDTAIKMLQQSIDNGWQGIFELKKDGKLVKEEIYIPTPTHELVDVQPTLQDHTGVREHARKQLERFYITGDINDLGNVIYDYLNKRGILRLSEQDKQEVRDTITKDAERRRTRFEEPYKGSIETDVKKELLRLYITANRVEL